jgi:hypothetical protein
MIFEEAKKKYLNKKVRHKKSGLVLIVYMMLELKWAHPQIEGHFKHPHLKTIPPGIPGRANIDELENEYEIIQEISHDENADKIKAA